MNGFHDGSKGGNTGDTKAGDKPASEEFRQILRLVAALNMIRMNLGMYPPGHIKITESFNSAFAIIEEALSNRSELTLEVAGNALRFGETVLDNRNTAIRDYVRTLKNLRILSVSFHSGLRKEELLEFNRILSSKPADIWAEGKIEGILAKAGIIGIKVKEANADIYSQTRESRVVREKAIKKTTGKEFWKDFLARLPEPDRLHPAAALQNLNEQRELWQAAAINYEAVIHEHFKAVREGRAVSAEQRETLTEVSLFIKELHPDLKEQFLEVVERQVALQPDNALIMENLKCFPRDIFLDIVNKANEGNNQISPALIMILQKLSTAEDKAIDSRARGEDISHQDMEKLLKREEHEKYIPEEYDQILKRAAQTAHPDTDGEERFPIQEYLKTITEDQLALRICQFLLALMDQETTDEGYFLYATRLTRAVPELIKSGQFPFLTDVMETLRRHGREGGEYSEKIRQEASASLKPFSDQASMEKDVSPFILRGLTDIPVMTKFLTTSGPQNIPWLFDLYLDPRCPVSTELIGILKEFGTDAIDEAVRRLTGQSSQKIVQLLIFLRATADKSIVASLKGLFDHEDWIVRIEVIETLFYYNDPAAVALLRKSLGSTHHEELFTAVSLTCRYRVKDLINHLLSLLKTFVIREKDTLLNDWILTQMGATGDPVFVPFLEKISRIRFSFTPGQLFRMKLSLYGSLVNFPRESVQQILERGKRSYHRKIRSLCMKILEQ